MKWTTDEFTGKRFGKYEVLCRLAIGGMAEIFLGFARSGPFVGRPVVIKRILNEQREDSNALQMLLDEAKMTATLSHPNVAQVMDLESDGEEILLVIEFITGANIEEIVEAYTARQEPVPLGFAITVIREAAQGLGHAHGHKNSRGELLPIIHRDVTPRNVMVDFEGATKVLDFGIARAKGSERRTQAGMVRGTTAYMSPEQAVGKDVDPRTDLFSLGTIFHELLTGQRLFYKGNPGQEMAAVYEGEIPLPSKVNRRVPKALDTVVMHILERKLEKRYQTATEFIRDLSLAAGSTAWGKDRCAELVRERFAARQKDIEKLIVRIPNRAPPAPAAVNAPAYPEGRTIVSKAQLAPLNDADSGARTMVGAAPLAERIPADRRPTMATEPGRELATDPGRPVMQPRPVTPAPQPPTNPTSPGLNESELFDHDDTEDVGARTRIIPGGSLRSLPRVSEQPTDPRRAAVPREAAPQSGGSSNGVLVLAAIVALLLGAVGGAFIFRQMQAPPPAQASVVRLSLSSDRPVAVWLGKQDLGTTPIAVFVPSGRHLLELREPDGPRRSLEVNLPPDESDAKMVVTLDSLPQLP
jgi:tRNA A-37 threonylcarbamoyl transferase component Bud32